MKGLYTGKLSSMSTKNLCHIKLVPLKIHFSRFSVCLKHVESPFSYFLHRILHYVLYALRAISQENFKMWGNMDPCQRPIFERLTLI